MLDSHKVSLADYVHLYSPALDWLLQCIAHKAPVVSVHFVPSSCGGAYTDSNGMLGCVPNYSGQIQEKWKFTGVEPYHLFLPPGLHCCQRSSYRGSYKGAFLSAPLHTRAELTLLSFPYEFQESDGKSYPRHKLYYTFGVCLALAQAPSESERLVSYPQLSYSGLHIIN